MSLAINGIENPSFLNLPMKGMEEKKPNETKGLFENLLHNVQDMNTDQKQASNAMQDVLLGKRDDFHNVLIQFEKTNGQLKFAKTITDKAVQAYSKIMDTPL